MLECGRAGSLAPTRREIYSFILNDYLSSSLWKWSLGREGHNVVPRKPIGGEKELGSEFGWEGKLRKEFNSRDVARMETWRTWKERLGRGYWESKEGRTKQSISRRKSTMRNAKVTEICRKLLIGNVATNHCSWVGRAGSEANMGWRMLISLSRGLMVREEGKTNIKVKQGQEKITGCVLFAFTCLRVKPLSYTFIENSLLVSALMIWNSETNLKKKWRERFRGMGIRKGRYKWYNNIAEK